MTVSLGEIALLLSRIGATAFGGPAAHIAILHDEVVRRRKWFDEQQFLDHMGLTNLIPGPNSTEMAIFVGHALRGWRGLIVAGASFILPAVGIVLVFAWAYVEYGDTPQIESLLYGIKPVVIAIVVQAIYGLGRKAYKDWFLLAVGAMVFVLYLIGVNELALLFGGGALVMAVRNAPWIRAEVLLPGALLTQQQAALPGFELDRLFLIFLKVGALLYGGGYVLLAFLRNDLVERLGWLTDQQLLDAIAIGQVTPGPLFATATFVGYVLGGLAGALLATVAIFLPSFVFVAGVGLIARRVRESPWTSALLDGVNAAALGLMAGVTVQLERDAIVDLPTVILALAAALALVRFRVNSVWLIAGGAVAGLALRLP
ncbi:MAG: chromate efflux transporter [Actinomycetota bacterium]